MEKGDDLKQLNPQKHSARRFLREYDQKQVIKPEKQPIYTGFPEKIKEFIVNYKTVIIIVLAILILLFFVLLFKKQMPLLNFIDEKTGENIGGYVYLDGQNIGSTTGKKFKGIPKEYCIGTHTLKLEYGDESFEWQTYPIDCMSKNVNFYIAKEKVQVTPQDIIFRFTDKSNKLVKGLLYFDGVFSYNVTGDVFLSREKCINITKLRFDYGINLSAEKNNDKLRCNNTDVVEFRIS
jgi:hypothetical protein